MSQIIPTYPIFEGSQVLTSDQLNQLSAYLDQQNRLTRSKLIGIGIVCGLRILPLNNGLKISKGLAITSEGFLIQIGTDFEATHYRPYILPETVSYTPFGSPTQNVTLWEMLSAEPEDKTDVKKLNNPANFLNDKYVLLFLEIFDRDLKSCLGNACDDKGKDRIFSLRRLLVNKTDLDLILTKSSNVLGSFPDASGLKTFRLKKPLFDPGQAESNQFDSFVKHYQTTITKTINDEFWKYLKAGYDVFEPLLGKSFGFANPFDQAVIINQIKKLDDALKDDPNNVTGIQYLWDFCKELALAWEEFVEAGHSLWYSCPTDPSLFPLHILLGKANASSESADEFYQYRHGFVQPPIFNEQRLLKETIAQRYRRLVLMIETLELDVIRKPKPATFPIKITPSKEKLGVLGDRSIPYYYDIKSKGTLGSWFSLEKSWSDPGTKNLWSSNRDEVLSYDNQLEPPKPDGTFLESPLTYDLEDFPFLRIEGHLNQNIEKAKSAIIKLIKDFNLPVHLEALHLDAGGTIDLKNCGWHDLQEEYAHHRLQLIGMINDITELYKFLRITNEKLIKKGKEGIFDQKQEEEISKYLKQFQAWGESLPRCLEDLDWLNFQQGYKNLLQSLLDLLLIQMKLMDKFDLSEKDAKSNLEPYNGLLARISPIVYRFLDLLYFTKIQRLYLSYGLRISQIQNSWRFSEYLKKNPSLVHEAGVYRGGTFYLLYQQSDGKVIGDFSLSGSACNCDCIDSCGEENWEILPPFARPGYAITLKNTAIEIEIIVDNNVWNRTYKVALNSDKTREGGEIKQDGSQPKFVYNPPKDFTGDDTFTYSLMDIDSGLADEGRITIWVRDIEKKSCYSFDILACWGEKNVLDAVRSRGLDPGNSLDFAIQSLLTSLQKTKGFTLDEIRSEFLEETPARKQLLSCLGIDTSNATYDDLEKRILEYQSSNCGDIDTPNPTNNCTSKRVKGIIADVSGQPIPGASINVVGTNIGVVSEADGRYVIGFPVPGVTLQISSVGFKSFSKPICSESNVNIVLEPLDQELVEVKVKPDGLNTKAITEILNAKGISARTNASRAELIKLVAGDGDEIILDETELNALKNETLKVIATSKNVTISARENKAGLIKKILGK